MTNLKTLDEAILEQEEDKILEMAMKILEQRIEYAQGPELTSPQASKDYVKLKLAAKKSEAFLVVFLNNKHRIIKAEEMFQGTIDGASVYPREVARRALELNAAAVIFAHNHPSGSSEPSRADQLITTKLVDALRLFDIRVLDHLVVGGDVFSFAEAGLM